MMPGFQPLDSHYILMLIGLLLGVAVFVTFRRRDKTIWSVGIISVTIAHFGAYLILVANAFDAIGQYWPQHHFSFNGMFLGLSLPFLIFFDPSRVCALGQWRFLLYLLNSIPWGIVITWLIVRTKQTQNLPVFPAEGLQKVILRLKGKHLTKEPRRRGAPRA